MPFDAKALARIHQLSRGVPRRINLLCDRALLGAYASGKGMADRAIVDKAAAEVFGPRIKIKAAPSNGLRLSRRSWMALSGVAAVALIGVVAAIVIGLQRAPVATTAKLPSAASAPALAAAASSAALAAAQAAATSASGASAPASGASFLTAAELPTRFKALVRNEKDAWRELAPEWKLALNDGDPCATAARAQVQCFRASSSSLALIRQLDRPGILMLRDDSDRPVYALLTGLTNDTATLRMAGVAQTVSLVSLATLWRGDFATFWRAPAGYSGKLVDAGSGPVASWVAEQIAKLRGEHVPIATDDAAAWKARVSAFQLAQGLKPDGLAGPTTFMQLNRASGVDEPHLVTSR
jgi:general secretion pathway protein A